MDQSLIEKYNKELVAHIALLERDYESKKRLYDVDQFLRKNFPTNDPDVYGSLVNLAKARLAEKGEVFGEAKQHEVVATECYEILKFLEPNTNISLDELKEAFFTCSLANNNEVIKKYDRYKRAFEVLNTLKKLFVRHQFRKSENSSTALEERKKDIERFKTLHTLLSTGELVGELEDVTSYRIQTANFTDEQWLTIYNYILLAVIKSYRKEEELAKEVSQIAIQDALDAKAKEMEDKILVTLPKESADVLKPVDDNNVSIETVQQETSTPVVSKVEHLVYLSDPILVQRFNLLKDKLFEHRKLGNISPTKEQSFSSLYDSLNNGNTLENVKVCYKNSDYIKFLFYCFKKEFERIMVDMETMYPVDEINDYTQLLLEDLAKPEMYINELEVLLQKEREEQERINRENETEVEEQEVSNPYKLIFYSEGGAATILKDIKRFTSEKMQDLISILTKIEEGRLEKSMVINKNVPVAFKSIRGDYIFVTFRLLNDGHVLICTASNLDELNSNLFKLNNYDSSIETKLGGIIRDGSLEYVKLMKEQEEIRTKIFGQGFTKGS